MDGDDRSIGSAVLHGALAGVVGGLALMTVERLEQQVLLPSGETGKTMGTMAADAIASSRGTTLSGAPRELAGVGLQLGYCAVLGAALGVLRQRMKSPPLVQGLALAAASYAATNSTGGVLPRIGAAPAPTEQPIEKTLVPIGAHLAFGVATAIAYDAGA